MTLLNDASMEGRANGRADGRMSGWYHVRPGSVWGLSMHIASPNTPGEENTHVFG
jgi:hypothetical protein